MKKTEEKWAQLSSVSPDGDIIATQGTVLAILRHHPVWKEALAYRHVTNIAFKRLCMTRPVPVPRAIEGNVDEWRDFHTTALAGWIEELIGREPARVKVEKAIELVALENTSV